MSIRKVPLSRLSSKALKRLSRPAIVTVRGEAVALIRPITDEHLAEEDEELLPEEREALEEILRNRQSVLRDSVPLKDLRA